MPTSAELDELCDNCTWTWTTKNGVNGCKVTGPNGNSIFLPANGYRTVTEAYYRGSSGSYWSSSLDYEYTHSAHGLHFSNSGNPVWLYYNRFYGYSVRPVSQ